ncbi:sugar ABC transporter ATP-binding protein [Acidisoma cellulosilytica]|uniref:Sugar ABC transporter ATP-binding protein n=1 Tax=Acidisoma cellulosilyticum TaxID=2802395 RepID=A0A963Z3U4_9PROT|nr:ATP-binding cassette domain-containing protein [Acidisoma cellulosilyticum]MCB8882277.1 sugar ABC transporter ATP-binding protein [Acidisoma cellulosilyticum]
MSAALKMAPEAPTPILQCQGIGKRFGGLVALSEVDFTIGAGEVVALLGDNGAGKSTLVKVISGVFPPDSGRVMLGGRELRASSPMDVRDQGIETVFQDLALCDNLGAAENIFLGRELEYKRLGLFRELDQARMKREAKKVLDDMHIRIRDLDAPVRTMSGGQRQAVAISRAVYWKAKLMILDEPTAALGVPEQKKVLDLIRNLKSRNVPVIVISHNMQDVFEVADRAFVMRRGRAVADIKISETTPRDVVSMMIG